MFSFLLRVLLLLSVFSLSLLRGQRSEAQPQIRPPHLVTGRYGMPAVVVGDDVCVVGGASLSGYRSDIECVDTQDKDLPVTVWKTQLMPRVFHTAESEGPYIYVMGGMTRDKNNEINFTAEVERLDTRDNSIELMAPMPLQLRTPSSIRIDKKIYVAGGSLMHGDLSDNLLIYDIDTNTWNKGAPMPEKKECDLLRWQGGFLAVGGFNGTKAVSSVQSYDIATNTWNTLPSLPVPTSAHHGAVVQDQEGNEHVALFGDYAEMNRVQLGDPQTGQWRSLTGTSFTAARHAAVVALDGKIYVLGGNIASLGSALEDIQVLNAADLTTAP